MALLTVNYRSQSLHRNVQFMVYLPTDDSRIPVQPPYKTYYLLHGMQYDCTAFPIQTSIIRKAREQGIAVVMPSGENSFFTDHDTSSNRFETYVAKELVEATRSMFPLSHKREDTFIGGFSMGGFGAMRIGLKYHETFSRITTFSAAIHFYETDPVDVVFDEDQWIGGKAQTEHTDINPRVLATELARIKQDDPSVNVPAIYIT
ncbi:MAG: acetylesterase [Erysipelotrichaceae bacterium]|nr:acetylesterase [Erysipelotrichaceae bacterium]